MVFPMIYWFLSYPAHIIIEVKVLCDIITTMNWTTIYTNIHTILYFPTPVHHSITQPLCGLLLIVDHKRDKYTLPYSLIHHGFENYNSSYIIVLDELFKSQVLIQNYMTSRHSCAGLHTSTMSSLRWQAVPCFRKGWMCFLRVRNKVTTIGYAMTHFPGGTPYCMTSSTSCFPNMLRPDSGESLNITSGFPRSQAMWSCFYTPIPSKQGFDPRLWYQT